MAHDHPHDDGHGHSHEHGPDLGSELSEMDARVRALETLLVERGLVDPAALDGIVETYEHEVGSASRRAGGRPGVERSGLPRVARFVMPRRRWRRWDMPAGPASI